ncbi:MAG: GTP cyclohydrolase I FolE [Paramuribaculum sp.]|nr:GTP cyclohydrolase I FolE [Paramuribaculum sp.]
MILENEQQRVEQIASRIQDIIELLGEDSARQGLVKTPMRAAKALWYVTRGYRQDTDKVINDAVFDSPSHDMVMVKDIEFYSMCEHHMLPFFGHISIAYIPDGKVLGLSKVARLVDVYARRLQLQERFTVEVCKAVMDAAGAKGVMAISSAGHMCMKMRGVEKQDSTTTVVSAVGVFENDDALRNQFFASL